MLLPLGAQSTAEEQVPWGVRLEFLGSLWACLPLIFSISVSKGTLLCHLLFSG